MPNTKVTEGWTSPESAIVIHTCFDDFPTVVMVVQMKHQARFYGTLRISFLSAK